MAHFNCAMSKLLLCGALLMSVACYRYVPAGDIAPRTGERARLELTDQGSAEMARLLGPGPLAVLGNVIAADDVSITLGVQAVEFRRREEQFWVGERLVVPRTLIARTERRQLSRSRTALATVVSLVAAVAIIDVFRGGEALFGGKRDDGGTTK